MIKILFICHGNICRSTMAQSYMQYLVDRAGLSADFLIDSAATSTEEIGSPIHHGTRKVLTENNIPIVPHLARQITKKDAEEFDYLIGMDFANMRNIARILGKETRGRQLLLLDIAKEHREVADPWYTGDFRTTFHDVEKGCRALLKRIQNGEI